MINDPIAMQAPNTYLNPFASDGAPTPEWESSDRSAALYRGDALELLRHIPDDSIDCVWTDPPYMLSNDGITCVGGRMVSVNKGEWDRSQGLENDHEFNLTWTGEVYRVLKPTGTLWVSGTLHVYPSVSMALLTNGFRLLNDIVWEKTNPPPNLGRRTFTHSTEIVLWASKAAKGSKHRYTFNYDEMRTENGGKQMQTVWRFGAAGRAEKRHGKHPTQKPVALIERCLRASTNQGDVVLDPFAGSGSTGVAALSLGRAFIGMEAAEEFVEIAARRLDDIVPPPPPPQDFAPGAKRARKPAVTAMDKMLALEKLQQIVGKDLRELAEQHGITVWKDGKLNKGWAGHTIERHLGLPLNSSRDPNLGGWELKQASLKWNNRGELQVKETMAITMLDPVEVKQKPFRDSHLLTKLRKIVAVARVYESKYEATSICKLVHAFDLEETTLYESVERDYEEIRQTVIRRGFGALTGKIGQFIQPRTKGPGHGSISRAFYARKPMVEYIIGMKPSPRSLYPIEYASLERPVPSLVADGGKTRYDLRREESKQ